MLFPRDLALSVGGLDPDNHIAMDYELWGKFFLAGASFQYTGVHFGIFRQHSDQKTFDMLSTTKSMLTAAAKLVRAAACFSEEQKADILAGARRLRTLVRTGALEAFRTISQTWPFTDYCNARAKD